MLCNTIRPSPTSTLLSIRFASTSMTMTIPLAMPVARPGENDLKKKQNVAPSEKSMLRALLCEALQQIQARLKANKEAAAEADGYGLGENTLLQRNSFVFRCFQFSLVLRFDFKRPYRGCGYIICVLYVDQSLRTNTYKYWYCTCIYIFFLEVHLKWNILFKSQYIYIYITCWKSRWEYTW